MNSQVLSLPSETSCGGDTFSALTKEKLTHSVRTVSGQFDSLVANTKAVSGKIDFKLVTIGMMLGWIASVSMYDMYWSFKTQKVLAETEQNPLGNWLISLDNGDIALFMTAKAMGNVFVLLIIPGIYCFRKNWGLVIAGSLAGMQLMLMLYLNFGQMIFPPC